MSHYTEHILELFVLNAVKIASQREEIEQHLAECYSCRELVQEMREFYAHAEGLPNLLEGHTEEFTAITLNPEVRRRPLQEIRIPSSLPERVWNYARRRPITSTVSVFGIVACLMFGILQFQKATDREPAKYSIVANNSKLEIYNKENKKLWELVLTSDISTFSHNKDSYSNEYVGIKDLDGDGHSEVITILHTEIQKNDSYPIVHVYNYNGTLRFKKDLGAEFVYGNKHYENIFSTNGLIVQDFDGDGKMEIYISLRHRNSPYVLLKLDELGNEIGAYWMCGHSFRIDTLSLNNRTYLALMGIDDSKEERKALLTILDPSIISGTTRGSLFTGYTTSISQAEKFVIQFPRTELESAMGQPKPRVFGILHQNNSEFSVLVGIPNTNGQPFGIADYYFTKDFRVKEVRFVDGSRYENEKFMKEGKTHFAFDTEYAEKLKEQVCYWDGKKWQNKPTKVGVTIAGK